MILIHWTYVILPVPDLSHSRFSFDHIKWNVFLLLLEILFLAITSSFGHPVFLYKYAKQLNFLFSTTTGNQEEAAPSLFLYFLWISSLWVLFNILSRTNFEGFKQQSPGTRKA